MRVSIGITEYPGPRHPDAAPLGAVAAAADEGVLDTLWVSDHAVQYAPGTSPEDPLFEAYTTLGWIAARTSRIRLGTMVTAVTFRPAALLIKAVTSLDVLSGGRAWFGVGAGYDEREAAEMGLPLPPVAERFERLEDTLQLAHRMWAGDESPFVGKHVRADRPVNSPNAAQRPRILIGGFGEKRTLPLVARYADACNLPDIPDGGATLRHKLGVLERACEAIGRPFDEIEKTVATAIGPDEPAGAFAERCAALAELGLDHATVISRGPWTDDAVARVTEGARQLVT
jgi:F420-dependent oxidoreductase-like protein